MRAARVRRHAVPAHGWDDWTAAAIAVSCFLTPPVGDGGLLPEHRPDSRLTWGPCLRGPDRARPVGFLRKGRRRCRPLHGRGHRKDQGGRDANGAPRGRESRRGPARRDHHVSGGQRHESGHTDGASCRLASRRCSAVAARGFELPAGGRLFGKGTCASCPVPYYTDNLMQNLQAERFFKPVMINNMMAIGDGAIETFPVRGIKDSR
jgi:hypothetical protein